MEPKIQSSFIPKKPVSLNNKPTRRRGAVGPLFVLSFIVLVGSGVLWGGLFFYTGYLESEVQRKNNILESARVQFAPALIQEIERFDNRITTTETLLNKHYAPSILFEMLEARTLRTIEFQELAYAMVGDGVVALSIRGVGNSFSSVALQSDEFNDIDMFLNPMFSDLNLDEAGNVTFQFDTEVEAGDLSYEKRFVDSEPTNESDRLGSSPDEENRATSTGTTTNATP